MDGSDYKLREREYLRTVRSGRAGSTDTKRAMLLEVDSDDNGDSKSGRGSNGRNSGRSGSGGDGRIGGHDTGDRIINKGLVALESGQSTINSLSRQDETVQAMHNTLDEVDYDMRVSDRILRGLNRYSVSVVGTAKNLLTIGREPRAPTPPNTNISGTSNRSIDSGGKNTVYTMRDNYEIVFIDRKMKHKYDRRLLVLLRDRVELVDMETRSVLRAIPYGGIRRLELADVDHCIVTYMAAARGGGTQEEHFEMFSIFMHMILDDLCVANKAIAVVEGPQMLQRRKNKDRIDPAAAPSAESQSTSVNDGDAVWDKNVAKVVVLRSKTEKEQQEQKTSFDDSQQRRQVLTEEQWDRREGARQEKLGQISSLADNMKHMALAIEDKLDDSNQRLDDLNRHVSQTGGHVRRNVSKVEKKL